MWGTELGWEPHTTSLWFPVRVCGVSVLFHVRWPPDPTCLFWWLLLAGPYFFFHFKYQVLHVASFMKIYAVIKKSKVHNLNCPWHPLLKYRDSPQPSARVRVLQADSFRKPESKQNLQPSWGVEWALFVCFVLNFLGNESTLCIRCTYKYLFLRLVMAFTPVCQLDQSS